MLLQLVLKRAAEFAPAADSDATLLQRFVANGDETAFGALLNRHGAMVWSVCRHLLADDADTEDAFQATFLALVRSAKRVRKADAVGAWLHGVAVRIATKAKRSAARRRQREERAAGPEADRPIPEATWNELLAAVHEEVQSLPQHLRTAFVLCELEGVRQSDAATQLGWKPGTLSGRLARARQLIVQRLADRGLAPALAGGGLALGSATAAAAPPVQTIDTTLSLIRAGGTIPSTILNLAKEVTPMMAMRSKLAAAAVLFAGGLGAVLLPLANAQPIGGVPGQPLPGGPPGSLGVGEPGGGPAGFGTSGPPRTDSGFGPPAAVTANRTQQWEYKFVPAAKDNGANLQGLPYHLRLFADLGDDGWEFCGTLPVDKNATQLVFKRPRATDQRGLKGGNPGGVPVPALTPDAAPGGLLTLGVVGAPAGSGTVLLTRAAPTSLTVFQLKHASALDLATVLEKVFGDKIKVTADSRSNSLIFQMDEKVAPEVKALIEKLDLPAAKP